MNDSRQPLTKTEQVLAVLKAGGIVSQAPERDGIFVLRDGKGREVPAWQNALKAAERAMRGKFTPEADRHSGHGQAMALALVIADNACRSEIECFAYWIGRAKQPDCYDLTKSNDDDHPMAHTTDKAQDVVMAQNAARYIDLRGDALPFRMVRDPSNPQLVHFEEKQ